MRSPLARNLLLVGAVTAGMLGSAVAPAAAAGTPYARLLTGQPALFLANLDDDAGRCQAPARVIAAAAVDREAANDQAFYKKKEELAQRPDQDQAQKEYEVLVKAHQKEQNLADREMAACNDAADTVVNGAQDAKDLARIHVAPWALAPKDASGRLTVSQADRLHLFVQRAQGWQLVGPSTRLTADEVRHGVELGLEGKDIIRDSAVWDGRVDVTLTVTGGGKTATNRVTLKEAPVLTQLNTQRLEQVFSSLSDDAETKGWQDVVRSQARASGASLKILDQSGDSWTQDIFEPASMSMPGPGGQQQSMKVLLGSVNDSRRVGSRVIFTELAGHDVAAVHTEHVPVLDPFENESYDSMGNLETMPPTPGHPNGQIVIGGDGHKSGPATEMLTLLKSQGVQNPIDVDTSWLSIGHVDEFIQFVPVPGGWKAVVADPTAGLQLLHDVVKAGHGDDIMHGGLPKLEWPYDERIDQRTTNEFLTDDQFVETNTRAATKIAANLSVLRQHGLTDTDIVRIPALYTARGLDYGMLETQIRSTPDGPEKDKLTARLHAMRDAVAEIPGTVNGLVLNAGRYVAPKTYGPVLNGKDLFATAITKSFASIGYQVTYANDLTSVHISEGELHCATNTLRTTPTTPWWKTH
ncbi:protein-arginine deiminase family protein [Kribbella ginsengisoli]|uniref:Protein-arginine deiminase C-terminal domain-containing protein n=1 Tax=Kribbella ginsengisoli TaxID=363865 RepID=A0ABP6XTN6_9ACTN